MSGDFGGLELIVGEQYQYYGHVYDVVNVSGGIVELHSASQRSNIRIQKWDRLQQAAKKGRLIRVREAPFAGRQHRIIAALDQKGQAALARRNEYVHPALNRFHTCLPRNGTKNLIKEIADRLGDPRPPCYNTLRNWVKRYLEWNESPCALIPSKKLHQDQWERLPEIVRNTIDDSLQKYYYIREPEPVSDIVGAIQATLETVNQARPLTDQILIPSASTLRRRIKEQGVYRRLLAQQGAAAASKALPWSMKIRTQYRLLQRIEGDTHILDIELVNDAGETIGKAALTVLIDVASRKIIGWDISVNSASAQKSMRALKPSLAKFGIGEEYRLDNGPENTDRDELDTAFSFLGPNITYCKVRAPNEKPYVERWFKTLTTGFTHALRGTTFSKPEDCGDYPSEKKAMYKVSELTQRFEYWLENVYHNRRHSGICTSPNIMWDTLAAKQPPLRRINPQDMCRIFLSKTTSTITNGRVRHKNLQWTCAELHHLQSLGPKKQRLDVFYDSSDLGAALVCHPDYPDKVFHAHAADPDYQNGLTFTLHCLLNKELNAQHRKFDFRVARDYKILLMEKRYLEEHKRGRRRAARVAEMVAQSSAQSRTASRPVSNKSVLPSVDVEKFFGLFDAPSIGDISEAK